MERLATTAALALAGTVLAAVPAQADAPVTKVNCDGSNGSGLTALEYNAMLASKACIIVQFDRSERRATASGLSRPSPGQGAVTQLALFRRTCGGSWTRVAYVPDADGWFGTNRDIASAAAGQGKANRVQFYASAKFSTRVNGTTVSKRLKTGVVGPC